MTADRRIRFSGFKCSTVAHTIAGLWRHPESQSHRYNELSSWIEIAKTLKRGKHRQKKGITSRALTRGVRLGPHGSEF